MVKPIASGWPVAGVVAPGFPGVSDTSHKRNSHSNAIALAGKPKSAKDDVPISSRRLRREDILGRPGLLDPIAQIEPDPVLSPIHFCPSSLTPAPSDLR